MFADVNVLAEAKEDTLLVPRSALTLVDEVPTVFVVIVDEDSRKAEQRSVTTGLRTKDSIEILSGIEAGEVVVTNGQANLVDGADVVIVE